MTDATPNWPVVVQHRGDAELLYIADHARWDADPDLSHWHYDSEDRMIDSGGRCFSLAFDSEQDRTIIKDTGQILSVEAFSTLIQEHMFALAQTCVSKIVLKDYEDGFRSLALLES